MVELYEQIADEGGTIKHFKFNESSNSAWMKTRFDYPNYKAQPDGLKLYIEDNMVVSVIFERVENQGSEEELLYYVSKYQYCLAHPE